MYCNVLGVALLENVDIIREGGWEEGRSREKEIK
jgi:hypothetical protein